MQLATIRIPSFDLELIKVTGQFSYPWHCHTKTWVIGAVISGKATLVTAESTRQPKWFVIPPLTGHALQTASQSTTITASLGPDTLRKAGPGTALDTIAKAFAQADWPANSATALAPALALAAVGTANEPDRPPWLPGLLSQLEAQPADTTVPAVSAFMGLSPAYLSRACAKQTGLPPHHLRMQYRLRRAQAYLAEGQGLADVAQQAGFYDQSHLSREFRRAVGVTPAAYRLSATTL